MNTVSILSATPILRFTAFMCLRLSVSQFPRFFLLFHKGGWVGEEAVALGLYCFLRNPKDYAKTVIRAANTNRDSDSIACIAGSISGAYLGIGAIPPKWVARIEKSEYLEGLAETIEAKKERLNQ